MWYNAEINEQYMRVIHTKKLNDVLDEVLNASQSLSSIVVEVNQRHQHRTCHSRSPSHKNEKAISAPCFVCTAAHFGTTFASWNCR